MQTCRIYIVDDDVMVRQGLSARLSNYQDLKVAGVSSSGDHILIKLESARPDALILNLESFIQKSGELLLEVRRKFPDLILFLIAASEFSAKKVPQEILRNGRSELVIRPRQETTVEKYLDELAVRIQRSTVAMSRLRSSTTPAPERTIAPEATSNFPYRPAPTIMPESETSLSRLRHQQPPFQEPVTPRQVQPTYQETCSPRQTSGKKPRIDLLVIASSTGGPNALNEILPKLASNFPVPILIVQHMPAEFTKSLADRLNSISMLEVREAENGETPRAGLALVAPGDYHMLLELNGKRRAVIKTNQNLPENSCRPAADVLFRSAAQIYGQNTLALILTGMGKDGLAGTELIKKNGGSVIVQDEQSSVVWGMPGEIAKRGIADAVLPLNEIVDEINKRVGIGR